MRSRRPCGRGDREPTAASPPPHPPERRVKKRMVLQGMGAAAVHVGRKVDYRVAEKGKLARAVAHAVASHQHHRVVEGPARRLVVVEEVAAEQDQVHLGQASAPPPRPRAPARQCARSNDQDACAGAPSANAHLVQLCELQDLLERFERVVAAHGIALEIAQVVVRRCRPQPTGACGALAPAICHPPCVCAFQQSQFRVRFWRGACDLATRAAHTQQRDAPTRMLNVSPPPPTPPPPDASPPSRPTTSAPFPAIARHTVAMPLRHSKMAATAAAARPRLATAADHAFIVQSNGDEGARWRQWATATS